LFFSIRFAEVEIFGGGDACDFDDSDGVADNNEADRKRYFFSSVLFHNP
jgi:hypothetical protein